MSTSNFYTLFWIVYFPLCIAFYDTIPSLQYSDELLTLLLGGYTFFKVIGKADGAATKEMMAYASLMVFYVIYSLGMTVNVSNSVWLDLQQQVRPYIVFYCTWMLRPQLTRRQQNRILTVMLLTLIFYAGALKFAPSLVTLYGETESAALGQLALMCAMTYYSFKPQTKRNLWICIFIMALGLIGGKSKFFGEMVVFVAIFYFLKGRIKLMSFKTIAQFSILTIVVLFFTWTKFNAYYVEGMAEDAEAMARPASYKTAVTILGDYFPFGSGLGTFATNAAAEYYSPLYYRYGLDDIWGLDPANPMFLADAYYPTLAEFGIFGIIFFLIFWKRRLLAVLKLPDDKYYKVGLMCILALALESTADSSYLSGKGMGYFMLLGMCLNSYNRKK